MAFTPATLKLSLSIRGSIHSGGILLVARIGRFNYFLELSLV